MAMEIEYEVQDKIKSIVCARGCYSRCYFNFNMNSNGVC